MHLNARRIVPIAASAALATMAFAGTTASTAFARQAPISVAVAASAGDADLMDASDQPVTAPGDDNLTEAAEQAGEAQAEAAMEAADEQAEMAREAAERQPEAAREAAEEQPEAAREAAKPSELEAEHAGESKTPAPPVMQQKAPAPRSQPAVVPTSSGSHDGGDGGHSGGGGHGGGDH